MVWAGGEIMRWFGYCRSRLFHPRPHLCRPAVFLPAVVALTGLFYTKNRVFDQNLPYFRFLPKNCYLFAAVNYYITIVGSFRKPGNK